LAEPDLHFRDVSSAARRILSLVVMDVDHKLPGDVIRGCPAQWLFEYRPLGHTRRCPSITPDNFFTQAAQKHRTQHTSNFVYIEASSLSLKSERLCGSLEKIEHHPVRRWIDYKSL